MNLLHIMPMNSPVYNKNIIEMINNDDKNFNILEHKFIMTNYDNYIELKEYSNVSYNSEILKDRLQLLRKESKRYDYIIFHSLNLTNKQLIFLGNELAKKIIWCVWGHDLYNNIEYKLDFNFINNINLIKNKIGKVIKYYIVNKFRGIAIGFKYDSLKIRECFGNTIEIISAPYGIGYTNNKIDNIIDEHINSFIFKDKPIKIMIGHSAYKFLNHEKILKQLMKYKDENIIISIPLSYGDMEYAKKIKKLAIEKYKNKVEFIDNMMSLDEYAKYLVDIDIAIFDYVHQAALANIIILLYMGKKLFLNENGIIYKAMSQENITTFNVEDIGKIDFYQLIEKKFEDNKYSIYSKQFLYRDNIVGLWKELFDKLKIETKKNNIKNKIY